MKFYSVTEVLSPFIDFSQVPESRLEAARIRGTGVHRVCLLYAQGLWPVVPSEYEGYFESFKKWWLTVVDLTLPIEVEPELKDEEFGYLGHPDLILNIKGEKFHSVWDLKTPTTHYPTWKAQLAAYRHLAPGSNRAGSIMLDANGRKPKVKEYQDDARDFAAFLAALTAIRYFSNKGR